MIRLLVLILVALLLAGGAVHLLGAEAGYVLLSYGEYTIEMTLWTLVGLTILGLILLWALVQLLMMVFGVPGSWGSWRKTRRRKASAKLSDQGQLASVEGDWQGAKQALEQSFAKDDGSQPLINYVLAARANHALGDAQAAGEALVDGAKHAPKGSAALGIVEAEMLADRGQLSKAQARLMKMGAGSQPAALRLQATIYEEKGEWSQLQKLLPKLNKAAAFDSAQSLALERRVFSKVIGQTGSDRHELEHAWKRVPVDLRHDPEIAEAYARQLIAQGSSTHAEVFLREAIPASFPDTLVDLYGRVSGGDARAQLGVVEGWLGEQGQSAGLLLCAGRLALANHKWDAARDYLESSVKRDQNPSAYAELARLSAHQGEPEAALEYSRLGLLSACGELPDLPLPNAKPRTEPAQASTGAA